MNAEVITLQGKKFAVFPLDVWEKLQERIEELQDIADCKEIEARIERGEGEYFPCEVVDAMLDGENTIKLFREYRGLTQAELAGKSDISLSMIKKLECGESEGSIKTIKSIAKALNIDVELLI